MSGTAVGVIMALVAGLAVVLLVGWPLLVQEDPVAAELADAAAREADATTDLHDELDRSLAAIKEIEQDHRAGNLSDADFAALDRVERARTADLVRRRDALN